MAIKWPLANGNWSNAANWNDGTLPDVGDDVHADGKTVTIDQDITVLSIRTTQRSGGTIGGLFQITQSGETILFCDITAGGSACLLINNVGAQVSITGNIIAGTSGNPNGITCQLCNLLNITGTITGGSFSNSYGIIISTPAIVNIIGNVNGGNATNNRGVLINNNSTIVNITGNVNGGTSTATSTGINIGLAGTVNLNGNCIGGLTSSGVSMAGIGGTFFATKIIGSNNSELAGLSNLSQTANVTFNSIEFSSIGTSPISGFGKFANSAEITSIVTRADDTQVTLIDLDNLPNELPTEANVRQGTSYNSGNKTGTLAVPDPSNVRKDIPTDNTVGTADLTAEDILNSIQTSENPVAERLRNVATVQTTGNQIATI
jgi:hypothetical protein